MNFLRLTLWHVLLFISGQVGKTMLDYSKSTY